MAELSRLLTSSISRRNLIAATGLSGLGLLAGTSDAMALNLSSSSSDPRINGSEWDAWNLVVSYLSLRASTVFSADASSILTYISSGSKGLQSWERHRAGVMSNLGDVAAWDGHIENAWSEPTLLGVTRSPGILKFLVKDITEVRWRPAPRQTALTDIERRIRDENPQKYGVGMPDYPYTSSAFAVDHVFTLELAQGVWKIISDGYQEPPSIGDSPDWSESLKDLQQFKSDSGAQNLRSNPKGPQNFNTLGRVFDWSSAYNYALTWATSRNSAYTDYSPADCANFVSQSFAAGGYPTDGVWFKYSGAWINNYSLRSWLLNSGRGIVASVPGALGYADIVNFDWNVPDGTYDHVAIVTGLPGPLVSCHTHDFRNVSYSWLAGPGTNMLYAITLVNY